MSRPVILMPRLQVCLSSVASRYILGIWWRQGDTHLEQRCNHAFSLLPLHRVTKSLIELNLNLGLSKSRELTFIKKVLNLMTTALIHLVIRIVKGITIRLPGVHASSGGRE